MTEPFPTPRALLRKHGLVAKKSWSQNFLVADRVYRAIVDAAVESQDDWVVEFGAGLGTLTMRLAERVPEGKVIAVERDRDLARVLEAELGHLDNVDIAEANALRYDLATVARWRGDSLAVCGNLPYHIASQILFRIIDARAVVRRAVVMIQREMAERIVAPPATKAYGVLSVLLGMYADARAVLHVDGSAFVPPPRVQSTVLRLDVLPGGRARVPVRDERRFRAVVKTAFGQRRKTLRNALRGRFGDDAVDAALAAADIDGRRRGETLTLEEFVRLSDVLPAPLDSASGEHARANEPVAQPSESPDDA